MKLIAKLSFLLIVASAINCESIDYKNAAAILNAIAFDEVEDSNGSYQGRSFGPVFQFLSFMRSFERVYTSRDELLQRLENFEINLIKADSYQKLDKGTARFGITNFTDYSERDLLLLTGFPANANGKIFRSYAGGHINKTDLEEQYIEKVANADPQKKEIPKNFDWREKGVIASVKNQGRCQCCWAFSAMGVVEAMNAIKTGNLTELSVQQLVDCDYADFGCRGGVMSTAFEYMIDNGGVETERDYPYRGRENFRCRYQSNADNVKVKEYTRIPPESEEQMKEWIYEHGPLSVGMNADALMVYRGGIIDLDEDSCDPMGQNHALVAIGYGEEETSDGKNIPYWIIRNSWGASFGEDGYFKMKRGSNTCGISLFVHGVTTE